MQVRDLDRMRDLLARVRKDPANRPVWLGCDARFRLAHTDDMIEMLERLGYATAG